MIDLLLTLALAADAPFAETRLELAVDGPGLLLRDLTGDGALELVRADDAGLAVFRLGEDLRYPEEPATTLAWPAGRVGWEVADLDGDGAHEVLLLEERGVVRHRLAEAGAFEEGRVLLEESAQLPAGVHRVHFVRDVDRNGRADLVLPGPGRHRIFLAREDGWESSIEVTFELRSDLQTGNSKQVGSSFGQQVRVPWFRIEDVDGDGRADLVSETEERIAFHLAGPELSSEPTWVLDLEALRDELPKRRGVDLDNLLSFLDQRVTWEVADLDGEAPDDLVLVLGSKLRIYLGGARTGPVGAPDQVLKSSGNVVFTYLRDTGRGGLPDLQILRAERISVTRVIRSLLLPSKLDFDVFTYRNEGGSFGRKPARRNRITLEIPRLTAFMQEEGGLRAEMETQLDLPTRRLPSGAGAAEGDDVVDVRESQIVLYEACAPAPSFLEALEQSEEFEPGRFVEGLFLRDLDRRGDGAVSTFDFGDVKSFDFAPAAVLRRSTEDREPALRHPLAVEPDQLEGLRVRDLNGDGVADVIAIGRVEDDWVVQFLVRR